MRRFYLYSALSIAVLAIAVAITALLSLALRGAGLALVPPTEAEARSTVAFTSAILLVAIPVGAVHYVLIARGLRDPEERSASVRHFYLNLWIFVALLVVLFAIQIVANATAPGTTGDAGSPLAAALVAAAVGIAGWRWRATTPPRSLRWENDAAYGAMVVALLIGLPQLALAVDGALRHLTRIPPFPGAFAFLDRQIWTGAWTFVAALGVWSVAAVWQWSRRAQPIRLRYLVTFHTLGVILFAAFADLVLAGVARRMLGHGSVQEATTFVPHLAIAAVLMALHSSQLRLDRGRNGRPPEVTNELLAAPVALAGPGLLAAAAAQGWTFIVDHVLALGGPDDALEHAAATAVTLALGITAYPVGWRTLRAGTPVRRFVVFTGICLALAAGVIAASTALFNGLSGLLAGSFARSSVHGAVTWLGIALVAFAVFARYLVVLRAEARTGPPIPPGTPPRDALLDTLEAVARGDLTPADGAARIRASGE